MDQSSIGCDWQVQEGLALWKLLQLPPKGPLAPLYQIVQVLKAIFGNIFPFGGRPIQTLLSTTLTPFSEIVRQNKFWVNAAIKPFRSIEYGAE